MGWFDGWKRGRDAEVSLDDLVGRARAGDTQGALITAQEKLARVEARVGSSSPAYATALFEHSCLCLALGMRERAVDALRKAADIRGTTREDEKNRLTYLMNLGDTLGYAGHLAEALAVQERGLAEREPFYGDQHPGFAYGLASYADVAIALGLFDKALPAAQRALSIYDAHGHECVPHAWALIFLAAAGVGASWEKLQISPGMASTVLEEISKRQLPVAPAVQRDTVEVLGPLAGDPERLLRAWVNVEHRARKTKDSATRRAALERVRDIADSQGNRALALDADAGLAMIHEEAGDQAAAARLYECNVERARDLGSPEVLCKVLRNAGLYFVERDAERGLALLREAAGVPEASSEELSRSGIALGIQLQHRAHLAEAREILTSALANVEPSHPDAICGRSHLRAIEEKQSCSCGAVGTELYAQVERMVRTRLPGGLLERLEFNGQNVNVHLARRPTEAEARLVADTVDLAMAEMRKRIGEVYGG